MNEKLEEVVNAYLRENRHNVLLSPYNALMEFGKLVCQWKEEQDKSASNDLDKEVHRFFEECIPVYKAKIYSVEENVIELSDYELTARHFAKWQKKQMMDEAVEGWVARDLDGSLWFHYHKPHLENEIEKTWWGSSDNSFRIYEPNHPGFENVTFEGGPIKVKLAIIKEG